MIAAAKNINLAHRPANISMKIATHNDRAASLRHDFEHEVSCRVPDGSAESDEGDTSSRRKVRPKFESCLKADTVKPGIEVAL